MYDLGLVGGTFDRFHAGHKKLIYGALEKCNKIEIWIVSDEIALKKNPLTMKFIDRKNEIIDNLDVDVSNKINFGVLENRFGPAPKHPTATAIICTDETKDMCIEINKMRREQKLDNLEIIEIEHQNAWDGRPISSTRIRNGEIDREGRSWISQYFNSVFNDGSTERLVMTESAGEMLKQPFGELIEGKTEDYAHAMRIMLEKYGNEDVPLITVGDVTTLSLQELNRCADISFIDGKTKRKIWRHADNIEIDKYDNLFKCVNPAGSLSKSLFEACKISLEKWLIDKSTSIIDVEGEEDLAPLLIHLFAPLGSIVVYGQPGRGIVVRITEEESKLRCKDILSSFVSL
ncbi:MAG: hypothetical protein CMA58_01225 [Euryarchaeota archaeon]|nr:hypothetical protein [Euryarchaeota archaeon]